MKAICKSATNQQQLAMSSSAIVDVKKIKFAAETVVLSSNSESGTTEACLIAFKRLH